MASAPLNIAQAADLVDLSIQKIFPKTSEPEKMYPKYYNTRTTEDYYEKDSSLSGLGESDFVDENAAIVSDVPIQGYDKTYTQNMVGIIVSFTWKMLNHSISWIVISLNKLRKFGEYLENKTIPSQARKGRCNDQRRSFLLRKIGWSELGL